ncbi:MAG: glycosyltransferase family 2 protein, partial [Gammaproteobacteria bacterium]
SIQRMFLKIKIICAPFNLIQYYNGFFPFVKKVISVITRDKNFSLQKLLSYAKRTLRRLNSSVVYYDKWYSEQLPPRLLLAQQDSEHSRSSLNEKKISIIMPVCDPQLSDLKHAVESIINQYYTNWELCIADDCSQNGAIKATLIDYAKQDPRIKIIFRTERGHISHTSNTALTLATGEYISFLDHDDTLEKDALYWVNRTILETPEAKLIYSDEDHIDFQGKYKRPYFKPDWNPDLLLSQNYVCHFLVIKKTLIDILGGFDPIYNGAQDYDLILRASERCQENEIKHIPFVLYHWREHPNSTALQEAKTYAIQAGNLAITAHLERKKINATVEAHPAFPFWYRINYGLPAIVPLVSIIIPTRNRCNLLKKCIDSIQKSDYKNIEIIIIDNGSDQPADLNYLKTISNKSNIKVISIDLPFNYARLNNMAVKHVSGDVLLFLNNDIEAIAPRWLHEIVSNVLRTDVGIVGARLWYPNFTLQHGGVFLGPGNTAGHVHHSADKWDVGYFGRAVLQQNFSAVTAACMAIRKTLFEKVGGFHEAFTVSLNDVDLCLRVREMGLKITWTPFAELIHYESASRGSDDTSEKKRIREEECALFQQRWGSIIHQDPAYNPNLSLEASDFRVTAHPRLENFMHSIRLPNNVSN